MLKAQQYFEFSLEDRSVKCVPRSADVLHNQQALELLKDLQRHRQNTVFMLKQPKGKHHHAASVVAIDIETTALKPQEGEIRLVSMFGDEKQLVTEDVAEVASILQDSSVLKVFHNAAFDVTWLTAKGYPVVNYTDTMVMGQILHNTAKSNNTLQALALEHLGIVLDKTLQGESNWQSNLTEHHKEYALKDAEITYKLYQVLGQRIEEKHLNLVLNREIAALPATIELNLNGIPFDYEGWAKVLEQLEVEAEASENEIRLMLNNQTLNLASPIQLKEAFSRLGILLESTTDEVLAKYEHEHPAVLSLRKYKKLKKQLSTYGEKLKSKISPDGRLRGQWRAIGTDTSRMTCKEPNLQGLPSIAKPYVKAPPGKCFVVADYSTIELRILAEITQDAELVSAFQNREDLHAKTSRAIFDKTSYETVTNDERKIGKIVNFGLIYGMSHYGLQKKIQAATGQAITLEEAMIFRNKYFDLYSGVLGYQNRMLKSDFISTLGGRYWSDETTALKKGGISRFNYPIQGTGAEGLKESLILLLPLLQPSWKLIAAIHDEILLEVPIEDGEKAEKVLVHTMKQGMQRLIPSIPIEVESNIAFYWLK